MCLRRKTAVRATVNQVMWCQRDFTVSPLCAELPLKNSFHFLADLKSPLFKNKQQIRVTQNWSWYVIWTQTIWAPSTTMVHHHDSSIIPEVLHGKLSYGRVLKLVDRALDRPRSRDLWIIAARASDVGTWRGALGGAGRFSRPQAFPPLISSIEVETVVVRGRRWLGVFLWEKARAPSHGAEKPTWWKHTEQCYLMGRRFWYAFNKTYLILQTIANMCHPNNVLTCLGYFHWQQFDDVTLVEAEQTFVICHETLQSNHMAWVLVSRAQVWGHVTKRWRGEHWCLKIEEVPWWAPGWRIGSWQWSEEPWATAAPSSHSSAPVPLSLHPGGQLTATLQNYIHTDLS